jgi:hypothetical protein
MNFRTCMGFASLAFVGALIGVGCSSSNNGTPASPDSGTPVVDSGKPVKDSGSVPIGDDDAATGDDGAAAACVPADETGFTATWHPAKAHTASCSSAQIDAYHKCLQDGQTQASPASCTPFNGSNATAANKACVACILTQDTAASYGPIVVHKGTIEMNVPGCLAVATNDLQGTGCAGKYQAASACRNASCAANCPVNDDPSFQAEQQCEQAAAAGTCKTFEDAAGCADALVEAGGAPAACLAGQSFDDLYDAIVPIFCGGADADGGPATDAGTD